MIKELLSPVNKSINSNFGKDEWLENVESTFYKVHDVRKIKLIMSMNH